MFKKKAKCLALIFMLICTVSLAVSAADVKPGLNVFTGNTSAFDFESDISSVKFSGKAGTSVNAVVVKAKGDDTANHAAAVVGNGGYVYFDIDFPTIEMKRPVKVSYDYILGIGGSQVRTLISYPNTIKNLEKASFYISYFSTPQTTETWRNASYQKSSEAIYNFNGNTSFYQGGSDITQFALINYSGKAETSYFDNVSLIPAYKLTYDLNGGIGSVDSAYFFEPTEVKLSDGTGVIKPGYSFKGWGTTSTSTAAVTAVAPTPGSDLTLYAIWEENPEDKTKLIELYNEKGEFIDYITATAGSSVTLPSGTYDDNRFLLGWKDDDGNLWGWCIPSVTEGMKLYQAWGEREVKPGVNIFENSDFENGDAKDVRPSNGGVSIVKDGENRVLLYDRGSEWASIQHMVKWESGRKYRISYKMKSSFASTAAINTIYGGADHVQTKSVPANTWTEYSIDYTFSETTSEKDAISFYYNPGSGNSYDDVYYDDLTFIPYYKVTYNLGGGTSTVTEEQFLGDSFTLTATVPTRAGFEFKGWSLTNGGVSAVKTVNAVPGSDITVYAIWENIAATNAIIYDFSSDAPGVGNGTISIKAPAEVASHTSAEVYFADNDGILSGYTPFAVISLENGVGSYAVNGNRGFPEGVTRLAFVFKADNADDITYWYTIPENHRFSSNGEPLYKFWATSDLHLGTNYESDYWSEMTVNKKNAMKDIFASDADFMFINGDVVNYGKTAYANSMRAYLDDVLNNPEHNKSNIPVFLTNGNHEYMDTNNKASGFDLEPVHAEFLAQIEYLKKNYPDITITHDGVNVWYSADIKGAKFIFLSSPEVTSDGSSHTYTMCKEQLEFLDEQLYDGEYSNKVNFVVTHVPLNNYVRANTGSGYEYGISNSAEVEKILAMHPNTVFCTGHSHSDLGNMSVDFVTAGDMTTEFTHLNDGCLVWISSVDGKGENGTSYIKSYSTGMFIEVYSDKVVIKSRKFLENSLYFGHAIYVIPTQDSTVKVAKATIDGTPADGATLTAVLDVINPDDYTYEWIVDGKIEHVGKTWTIDGKGSYGGEYVYLRAVDKNGYYASTKSATAFNGVTVKYDLNGGTGTAPATEKVLPGEYVPDNAKFPKKSDCFFIGWSTDKNAKAPMATVDISDDVTLYAVYSAEPKFYFDASFSGFVENGQATTKGIIDGNLVTTVENGSKDQYYTLSDISINAEAYPILRIKADIDGTGDGVFYSAKDGTYKSGASSISFSESSHFRFHEATVAAELDGYKVYEFDTKKQSGSAFENWSGTVTKIRYDALTTGTNKTDYLVFTDKNGVFTAEIILENGSDTAFLSESTKNCTVGSVSYDGSVAEIKLVPADGYEFTTAEDVMAGVKINGEKPISAYVDDNGNAFVKYEFATAVNIGDGEGKKASLTFEKPVESGMIIVACYDGDGRFVGTKIVSVKNSIAKLDVNISSQLGATLVKAFAFDGLSPICECVSAEIK